jgi:DNA polymerase
MAKHLSLDYETRSECDLKACGAYVYAKHPSTTVLCAVWYYTDGKKTHQGVWRNWPKPTPMPKKLEAALRDPDVTLHAWNAQFERLITQHVCGIYVAIERTHCTAAWARARGLPGKLEGALEFAQMAPSMEAKREGSKIMLKWCKPLPNGGWADDPDEYERLVAYCAADVDSELNLAAFLDVAPLEPSELKDFWATERVNDTGLPVDVRLAKAALKFGAIERREIQEHIHYITGGEVTSSSAHAKLKVFLKRQMPAEIYERYFTKTVKDKKTGGTTVKETTGAVERQIFMASTDASAITDAGLELLEAVDDANKSSVAKYQRIVNRAEADSRVRGAYMYAGAAQTKRFSSTGVQMHNLPRAVPKDLDGTIKQVLSGDIAGRVMHVLASCLRPTIVAPKGRVLVWGDWSSVEARGMPWLAECANVPGATKKLDLYRDGVDVYKVNAQDIYGTPYDDVPDNERQVGKVSELALQFGGFKGALMSMARGYRIAMSEPEAIRIASAWRDANQWAAMYQKRLYTAYLTAAVSGRAASVGGVTYERIDLSLKNHASVKCTLPDGTALLYPGGQITRFKKAEREPAGAEPMATAMGYAPKFKPVEVWRSFTESEIAHFVRSATGYRVDPMFYKAAFGTLGVPERVWHGLLSENVTQALCAALLRDCLLRVEASLLAAKVDARIIGHTHDEIILEASAKAESRAREILFEEMVRVPSWAKRFPLGAEIKSGQRYTK